MNGSLRAEFFLGGGAGFWIAEELIQDLFGGGVGLFGGVAFRAARYTVSARGTSAARDGNHMIHRKVLRADLSMAVVAFAFRDLRAPPVRGAQFARLCALTLHMCGVGIEIKPVHG